MDDNVSDPNGLKTGGVSQDGSKKNSGRGGARPGAGRKKGGKNSARRPRIPDDVALHFRLMVRLSGETGRKLSERAEAEDVRPSTLARKLIEDGLSGESV